MKQILALMLAVAMLMTIAGCKDAAPNSTEPTQTTTAPTQETTAPTEVTTDPTQAPTSPTEGATVPTEAASDPTEGTTAPTQAGTVIPTTPTIPTQSPTGAPAQKPTTAPTQAATAAPTDPTQAPTQRPTSAPTQKPTSAPTLKPTAAPTQAPTTPGHTHSYTAKVTPPSCTLGGYTTYTCACGHSYVSDQTAAKGHGTTRTETKEATTAEPGYTKTICTVCNTVLSTVEIPQLQHTCTMERINCKDLKDNAVGWYTVNYRTYKQCSIMACSVCGTADTSTLEFIYTPEEATAKIVEMINEERYRVYGTHEYDVVVATHHSAAQWGAAYITNDFQHCTPFRENIYQGGMTGDMIKRAFDWWMNSPAHYSLMIDKNVTYASLGVYVNDSLGFYSMLIMWDRDELYLDNPNYTWIGR